MFFNPYNDDSFSSISNSKISIKQLIVAFIIYIGKIISDIKEYLIKLIKLIKQNTFEKKRDIVLLEKKVEDGKKLSIQSTHPSSKLKEFREVINDEGIFSDLKIDNFLNNVSDLMISQNYKKESIEKILRFFKGYLDSPLKFEQYILGENILGREDESPISALKNDFNTLRLLIDGIRRKSVKQRKFVIDMDHMMVLAALKKIAYFEVGGETIINLYISKEHSSILQKDEKNFMTIEKIERFGDSNER